MTNFVPTPTVPAPDIVRCAYLELVVTDLAKSREFYVDLLGLHVTEEDEYFPPPRELRELMSTLDLAAPALFGGPLPGATREGAFSDDRKVDASDVLAR